MRLVLPGFLPGKGGYGSKAKESHSSSIPEKCSSGIWNSALHSTKNVSQTFLALSSSGYWIEKCLAFQLVRAKRGITDTSFASKVIRGFSLMKTGN